jgi:hypothetical protein
MQPQRDKCRLHRLLDDRHQLLTYLVQIDFIAELGAEGCYCLGCIILVAVEPTVDDRLNAAAQGLE